jgi:hypothetical protein
LVGFVLEFSDLTEQELPLSLGLHLLGGQLVQVFIFLADLIQEEVASANLVDLLDDVVLNGVVVQLDLSYLLVVLQGLQQSLSRLLLQQVVSQTDHLEGGELTFDHLHELLSQVLARDEALGHVQFLETECLFVFQEGLGDLLDTCLDRIALQIQDLQIPISSESLADVRGCLLIEVAETEIEVLEDLVAIEELLDHLEELEVGADWILAQIEVLDLVIGLETHNQLGEALGGDVVAVQVQVVQVHFLMDKQVGEVLDALGVDLGVGQIESDQHRNQRA